MLLSRGNCLLDYAFLCKVIHLFQLYILSFSPTVTGTVLKTILEHPNNLVIKLCSVILRITFKEHMF